MKLPVQSLNKSYSVFKPIDHQLSDREDLLSVNGLHPLLKPPGSTLFSKVQSSIPIPSPHNKAPAFNSAKNSISHNDNYSGNAIIMAPSLGK